jgi:hypothetical protein
MAAAIPASLASRITDRISVPNIWCLCARSRRSFEGVDRLHELHDVLLRREPGIDFQ